MPEGGCCEKANCTFRDSQGSQLSFNMYLLACEGYSKYHKNNYSAMECQHLVSKYAALYT